MRTLAPRHSSHRRRRAALTLSQLRCTRTNVANRPKANGPFRLRKRNLDGPTGQA
jgi:hypothetical protein